MSGILIGTHYVLMDEPCFSLKELNERTPDSRGIHRYQVVKLMRNDKITEMRRDLGPAKNFTSGEFVIPGGVRDPETGRIWIEEKVGDLMDMADLLRSNVYERPEPPKGIDLIQGYYDSFDKRARRRKKQTTFGHGGWTQRS